MVCKIDPPKNPFWNLCSGFALMGIAQFQEESHMIYIGIIRKNQNKLVSSFRKIENEKQP
jgi:hypothetical protein